MYFYLYIARPSSLPGTILKVAKDITNPKREMKSYLETDLSSLCGLRAPSKTYSMEAVAPGGVKRGALPSVQYLGALENYIQWDCMAHPEAISETVFRFVSCF